MKYIKKPLVVDAIQYIGENIKEILTEFGAKRISYDLTHDKLLINTLEGEMICSSGDYIIRGINGELYPCKEDIFLKTYDPYKPHTNY